MKPKHGQPRSRLPRTRGHIPGWPREHYNADHSEKVQYKSEQSARGVATMMRNRYGEVLEPYRCTYCGCWHLGHTVGVGTTERQLLLKHTIEGELAVLKRYHDDLQHIAAEVLAIQTKMERLEILCHQHYQELLLLSTSKKTK